jgi:hypothetical protein
MIEEEFDDMDEIEEEEDYIGDDAPLVFDENEDLFDDEFEDEDF